MRGLFLLLAGITACGSVHLGSPAFTCSPEPPRDAIPPTSDRIGNLAGRYRVVQVTTSYVGKRGADRQETQLELSQADSATRLKAQSSSLGRRVRRDLRLIGVHEWGAN